MEKRFFEFLKKLNEVKFENEMDFQVKTIPHFFKLLGYSESNIFFDVMESTYDQRLRIDAVVAADRTSERWILIEAKAHPQKDKGKSIRYAWIKQLHRYKESINPRYAVLIHPNFLIIIGDNLTNTYSLDDISEDSAKEIFNLLKKPETLPSKLFLERPSKILGKHIESDTFKINLQKYSEILESVIEARTNDEKKKSLEHLARFLFESIPFLKCKYSNLRTASSEIDLIIEYKGHSTMTLFDEFGRYFLVECKNWQSPVGASVIRDFLGKMEKSKIKLGIILSRNGITGAHGGADALRDIHATFDSKSIYILVLTIDDLQSVERAKNLYDLLDEKIDALKFDFMS